MSPGAPAAEAAPEGSGTTPRRGGAQDVKPAREDASAAANGAGRHAAEPGGEGCPLCGAPLDPNQGWCLRCGSAARTRLATSPRWRAPIVALAAVALLSLGVLAAALVKLAGKTTPKATTITSTIVAAAPPTATTPATTAPGGARAGTTGPAATPGTTTAGTVTPGTAPPGTASPGTASPGTASPRQPLFGTGALSAGRSGASTTHVSTRSRRVRRLSPRAVREILNAFRAAQKAK